MFEREFTKEGIIKSTQSDGGKEGIKSPNRTLFLQKNTFYPHKI